MGTTWALRTIYTETLERNLLHDIHYAKHRIREENTMWVARRTVCSFTIFTTTPSTSPKIVAVNLLFMAMFSRVSRINS